MKPTEQAISDFARQEANRSQILSSYPFDQVSVEYGVLKGAQWAISLQPEWVSVTEREPLENQEVQVCFEHIVYHEEREVVESGVTSAVFSKTELLRPIFCKVNGWVVLGVTHWKPLSQPPTK